MPNRLSPPGVPILFWFLKIMFHYSSFIQNLTTKIEEKNGSVSILPGRESVQNSWVDETLVSILVPPQEIQYLISLSLSFPTCKMAISIFSSSARPRHEDTPGINLVTLLRPNIRHVFVYWLLVGVKRNWFAIEKMKCSLFFNVQSKGFLTASYLELAFTWLFFHRLKPCQLLLATKRSANLHGYIFKYHSKYTLKVFVTCKTSPSLFLPLSVCLHAHVSVYNSWKVFLGHIL